MGQWVWYPNLRQWVWTVPGSGPPQSPFKKKRSLWWLWTLLGLAGMVGVVAVGLVFAGSPGRPPSGGARPLPTTPTLGTFPTPDVLEDAGGFFTLGSAAAPMSLAAPRVILDPIAACEQYTSDHELKSPASARYSRMVVVRVDVPDHKWYVTGYVDSANSFGAVLRSHVDCEVWTYDGETFLALVELS